MTLNYFLDENDFLEYHLYTASKSERIKEQRTRSWLVVTGCVLGLSLLFYMSDNNMLAGYFLIVGLLTLFIYPSFQRAHYRRYYQKFIEDIYQNRIGQICNVTFTDIDIQTSDITGETRINHSAIGDITEIQHYFFVKLQTGGHLIVPKSKVDNVDELRKELQDLSLRLSIGFIQELKWKWK